MAAMAMDAGTRPVDSPRGLARDEAPLFGRADLHVHTAYGDGTATATELFDRAEQQGRLDVIAIVDHDDIRGALAAREAHARGRYHFDLVPGIEVTTRSGHLLALWVEAPIKPLRRFDETVAAIHNAGGLAVVPHPFSYLTRSIGQRTLEGVLAQNDAETRPDGIEIANLSPAGRVTRARAHRMNRERYGLAETGGSDTHFIEALQSAYTLFPGHTAGDLRRAIESRQTHGVEGAAVSWRQIGARRLVMQQVIGLSETPKRVAGPVLRRLGARLLPGRSAT